MNNTYAIEEIVVRDKKYMVTNLDHMGKINGLKRFNEKTKMWVTVNFINSEANIEEIDSKVANILGKRNHYIFNT